MQFSRHFYIHNLIIQTQILITNLQIPVGSQISIRSDFSISLCLRLSSFIIPFSLFAFNTVLIIHCLTFPLSHSIFISSLYTFLYSTPITLFLSSTVTSLLPSLSALQLPPFRHPTLPIPHTSMLLSYLLSSLSSLSTLTSPPPSLPLS